MTTILIALPLVAAAVLVLVPLNRLHTEAFALLATLAEIVVGAVALLQFDVGQGMQFVTDQVWISTSCSAPRCATTSAWTGWACS